MKLKHLSQCLALAGFATCAFAQQTTEQSLQRVEITGSSIKRIAKEGALPIQVITSEDMTRQGITSAEQLLRSLGVNAAGADTAESNNNVFGADTDRLMGGAATANLRGLGASNTLVLLNGRRVSTHGMSGGAVDLNAIPMAAVARVEVLKDGASAIYGTDAIGGVINFILKNDFNGAAIDVDYSQPQRSGGGATRRVSLTVGKGSLTEDKFNLMASLTADKNDILRGSARDWANGFQPALGLSPNSSSAPFANIINASGSALPSAGSTVGTTDTTKYTRINVLGIQGQCDAIPTMVPFQTALWSGAYGGATPANSKYMCNTDYGRQYMLAAPKDATNFVARGGLKLSSTDTAFVEVTTSRTSVLAELTPTQFSTTAAAGNFYPVNGPYYLNLKNYGVNQFDPTKPISYRWRMQDFGNRVIENVSENARVLVGLDGEIGSYSYKLGVSKAQAEGFYNLVDGYAYSVKLNDALKTGLINPWVLPGQTQTAAAMALIESTKARGRVGGGKTGLTQVDGTLSGELMKLPAGSLEFAAGFDLRRETYEFAQVAGGFTCVSTLATTVATDVLLCPGNSTVPPTARDIRAVFSELAVPVFKGLDLQLAVRHDQYSGAIGSTTNPKAAFRYQPTATVMFRGSVNTGFRAPTFQQQTPNTAPRNLTGAFSDPVKCPTDPTQCAILQLPYTDSGNTDLKPEKSKQGTIGFVVVPLDGATFSVDYWHVDLSDRISKLTTSDIITNYQEFSDRFIRDANGNVTQIAAGWINAADSKTSGIDWSASFNGKHSAGTWRANVNGTYMISHKERLALALPMVEYVGQFGTRTLYLRNKVSADFTWTTGPWSATVNGSYSSGYRDQAFKSTTPPPGFNEFVNSYSIFGLFTTYKGFKNTSITVGVRNLFDTQPPFTHHDVDDVVGAGWDPRVADPRGRTLTANIKYQF